MEFQANQIFKENVINLMFKHLTNSSCALSTYRSENDQFFSSFLKRLAASNNFSSKFSGKKFDQNEEILNFFRPLCVKVQRGILLP